MSYNCSPRCGTWTNRAATSWSLIQSRICCVQVQEVSYRAVSYLQWGMPFHRTVASKVGYVPGEIYHLWQGDAKNRNYRDRFKVLADFNPDADVYVGDNGAWYWTN